MGRFLKRIEDAANRIGLWATAYFAMTSLFSWLSSHLVAMKPYGWPEAILVGFLLASLTVLVLAAVLASWRFFRPLRPAPAPRENARQRQFGPPDISTPELAQNLRAEIGALDTRLSGQLATVQQATRERATHISTPELRAFVEDELLKLKRELGDIRGQIKIDYPNASTVAEAFMNLDQAVHLRVKSSMIFPLKSTR